MAYGTINADLMTTSDGVSSSGLYGFKNRIINGGMAINQRAYNATPSTLYTTYTLDRWFAQYSVGSKFSVSQTPSATETGYATRVGAGFTNYLAVTSASSYSISSGDSFAIIQNIEGFNTADLAWGTSNAKTITLSFWVYSSLTGAFGGCFQNSAGNRSYPFTYTISSANTWTQISVTVAGDTSGTWIGATNGIGITLQFGLGNGSSLSGTAGAWAAGDYRAPTGATSVVGTNGATFYITGVQLEKGSTATSFDYRPYTTELQLAQRYCYVVASRAMGETADTTYFYHNALTFPVTMRTTPTMSNATYAVSFGSAGTPALLAVTGSTSSKDAAALYNSAANWTATVACAISATFNSEL